MRRIRRVLSILFVLSAALCLVLLLNFTAPNPTGRRYSSEMPVTTGLGSAAEIGRSAELILAKDLRLPRNDAADQRKCICSSLRENTATPAECNVCVVSAPISAPFRRPDFVGAGFIAEAKNTRTLLSEEREGEQIADYAQAARAMRVPLYIFTRVDTQVEDFFERAVAQTGGAVVRYFTVPNWTDPVDAVARSGLLISLSGLLLLFLSAPRKSLPRQARPRSALSKAIDSVETAQRFAERLRDKVD